MPTCPNLSCKHLLFWGTVFFICVVLALLPPVPQDPHYHHFADDRPWLGFPNVWDVVSNLPYLVFGLWGIVTILRQPPDAFLLSGERRLWLMFFACIALVSIGSSYYHLAPSNARLVWDRIPIALAFMALYSLMLAERLHPRGLHAFWLLAPAAVGSIFLWYQSELAGQSDLRAYLLVQLIPIATIPLLLWLFPARYNHARYYLFMLGWYLLAKLFEFNDALFFDLTQGLISGHSLKHLASAMSAYVAVRLLQKRQPLAT
jgi:hypothetical protein